MYSSFNLDRDNVELVLFILLMFDNPRIPPANYNQKINKENESTGLPTKDETVKTTQTLKI